ncbi:MULTISPECIES: VOC family protein [Pseudonocardia]|uniref:Glyoxalase-like domain protein n=2 Tax=Pseudonocardia TaxID=1847 RepID=A0A1Y2MS76_PSEAH|nr:MULTISPECIES: VOC family protein [Pseudonocardia]OSY38070.1 Glyoxalase-like domain protein [Pseudonocardia autotrophica]TDN75512.1 putative enzyme related to lactoylglutathione lyase [Pseudonocardia autotrophica]BBF99480.1 hypothetical protein Pdca_06900 [Pseudonocardia autotrophica]GEC28481.1 hypothetical protein PSA01_55100 [Pseudonocardia saturnea]
MKVTWEALTIDVRDPVASARWWAATLDWEITSHEPAGVEVHPPDRQGPSLFFVENYGAKLGKNRLHLDLAAEDQAAVLEQLISRGATRVDIGQAPDADCVVLSDPDGNEFCLLEPHGAS